MDQRLRDLNRIEGSMSAPRQESSIPSTMYWDGWLSTSLGVEVVYHMDWIARAALEAFSDTTANFGNDISWRRPNSLGSRSLVGRLWVHATVGGLPPNSHSRMNEYHGYDGLYYCGGGGAEAPAVPSHFR